MYKGTIELYAHTITNGANQNKTYEETQILCIMNEKRTVNQMENCCGMNEKQSE